MRLFGAWTALPAGPATLAAKTGSLIVPISVRRLPDDTFHGAWSSPIEVPSSDPADLQRATQAIADALASSRRGGARPVVQLRRYGRRLPRRRPISNAGPASCWTASRTRARTEFS